MVSYKDKILCAANMQDSVLMVTMNIFLYTCSLQTTQEKVSTTQQESLLRDLISHVRTTKWYRLGLQLDLDDFKLQEIEVNVKDNEDRLRKMFQAWLEDCVNPSWKDVVKALKEIGDRKLGAELEKQFCK